MPIHEKASLLVPSGTYHDPEKKHLHVICSNPDANGDVVIVSITSYTNDLCDQTCLLQQHEHPWLRHLSYVLYRKAEIVSAAALKSGVESGEVIVRDDVKPQTYLRIKNGLCNSTQTKRKVKQYLGC
jgi:hypothetical protein